MNFKKSKLFIIPAVAASFASFTAAPTAQAWTDQTHMANERAAGLMSYQNA